MVQEEPSPGSALEEEQEQQEEQEQGGVRTKTRLLLKLSPYTMADLRRLETSHWSFLFYEWNKVWMLHISITTMKCFLIKNISSSKKIDPNFKQAKSVDAWPAIGNLENPV